MELKVSSPKIGDRSPPGCVGERRETKEKEVSDDDDDDRNHKHRRRDTHSESLETDSMGLTFTKSYKKRNKFFENGQPFRENESEAGETWKNNNNLPLDKYLASKFDRRRPGLASIPRGNLDVNQRFRSNQPFSGDSGPGRGRGRENSWNQCDSWFNPIDIASQMVHPGSVAPGLFSGRGLPNASNAQSSSWGAFGMMPGIPNGIGGVDTLHPIGLQGVLRPPMNSSLNIGIPRPHQRCRDFEERGFCLRGDMCPMEHGVNRIVIEDVQSLSQFNLPGTVPSAQLLAIPAGSRPLPLSVPPTNFMNSKGMHSETSKPGMTEDALCLNGAYTSTTSASVADLYDPDQPLLNNSGLEASAELLRVHSPKIDETEPLPNDEISDCHNERLNDRVDNELPTSSIGSKGTSLSVWGRIDSSRSRIDTKEKDDLTQSDYPENEAKEGNEAFLSSQGASCQVKRFSTDDDGSKFMDSSFKSQTDNMRNSRKSSQKALRTLFVNGIPLKNNKREALLSHFCKFGEVIDIYIPVHSERAFVQFSRREEAEAALKAPDAVMGNRFIKLWWANRDSVPDNDINIGSSVAVTSCDPTVSVVPAQPVVNRVKDNLQPIAQKNNVLHAAAVPSPSSPKPSGVNGPKVPLPLQKKLETLGHMKEELRKKQEMLEQKRNDFRRQLEKLQKQSGVVKGDLPTEQDAKRQKVGVAADPATTPSVSDPGACTAIPCSVGMTKENNLTENIASHRQTSNTTLSLQECKSSKQQSCPSTVVGHPYLSKYKLDNRPTAFSVIPPLPSGFADVDVLKEHFLQYGDLSAVELEDVENGDGDMGSEVSDNCSVLITYGTRRSAERAYSNGKCWQGNKLQFTWLTSSSSAKETLSSTPKGSVEADVLTEGQLGCSASLSVVASCNKGCKSSEGESFVDHVEFPEVSGHNSSPSSSVKESPKGDGC